MGSVIMINPLGSGGYSSDVVKGLIDKSITSIELPSDLTSIGDGAFYRCTNLTSISLPSGVTNIGAIAFYRCTNLTSISLPSGLISIGATAFNCCRCLVSLTFNGTPTTISPSAFSVCTNLLDIYVPWSEGAVANAPWGATNATIHYNTSV